MKKYFVILVAVTMAVTTGLFAQDSENIQTTKTAWELGREFEILEDSTVNYLMPVFQMKKHEETFAINDQTKWDWVQVYPTVLSRLTNENNSNKELVNQYDQFRGRNSFISIEKALHINDDALNYLIQKSKDERVVMLNENHFIPNHRILAEILIDSLYNYGFRYLAMEGIYESDIVLNERRFAITSTGYYTREPMMANLIRKAIDKGYYVFGYDFFEDVKDREKNGAYNIIQKSIAKDSIGKVFVLAGHGHINEAETTPHREMMARMFFLQSGIDPLTIHQEGFRNEETYLMFLDKTAITTGRIICDIFITNNIDYDLFAEKSGYKNYEISIPSEIAARAQTESLMYVVSIFKANEYQKDIKAIPVYNYVLNCGVSNISVKLPDDTYFYTIKDRYGKILHNGNFGR